MAETPSTMLDLGTQAPEFTLPDPRSGNSVSLSDYASNPVLVVFACNHCPYVIHVLESFTEFAREAQQRGLGIVMISSNDIEGYPQDGPGNMAELSRRYGFDFPYLYDESQQVAIEYRAACTPDFFLFDNQHRLVYRGQYDSSRPGNSVTVSGKDLKAAVEALFDDVEIPKQQIPSVGCNIKWRTGNEPDYF